MQSNRKMVLQNVCSVCFLKARRLTWGLVEIWQFRFAAECVAEVTARTLTAEGPSYTTIMELDHRIRDFPLPEGMSDKNGKNDMSASFRRCVLEHIKETGTGFGIVSSTLMIP
jgi:hypothetical protein